MFGKNKKRNGFWRGYASVLSISPIHDRAWKRRYLDILLNTSSADALKRDWETVGSDLYSALASGIDERTKPTR